MFCRWDNRGTRSCRALLHRCHCVGPIGGRSRPSPITTNTPTDLHNWETIATNGILNLGGDFSLIDPDIYIYPHSPALLPIGVSFVYHPPKQELDFSGSLHTIFPYFLFTSSKYEKKHLLIRQKRKLSSNIGSRPTLYSWNTLWKCYNIMKIIFEKYRFFY